jgi:hypothetical protein
LRRLHFSLMPLHFSARLRWLAAVGACFSAVFGAPAFGALFLILGGVIQPRAPTTGRWLTWTGALLLSIVVVPSGVALVLEDTKLLRLGDLMLSLMAVSAALVCWCDGAVVMEGFRSRHSQWVRGSLDWVVWIVAIILSAWLFWSNRFVVSTFTHIHDRPDLILTTLGFGAFVLVFDIALIIHAVKTHRPSGGSGSREAIVNGSSES